MILYIEDSKENLETRTIRIYL